MWGICENYKNEAKNGETENRSKRVFVFLFVRGERSSGSGRRAILGAFIVEILVLRRALEIFDFFLKKIKKNILYITFKHKHRCGEARRHRYCSRRPGRSRPPHPAPPSPGVCRRACGALWLRSPDTNTHEIIIKNIFKKIQITKQTFLPNFLRFGEGDSDGEETTLITSS